MPSSGSAGGSGDEPRKRARVVEEEGCVWERGIDASGGDGDGAPLASMQPPRKRLCAPTARTLHPLQRTPAYLCSLSAGEQGWEIAL